MVLLLLYVLCRILCVLNCYFVGCLIDLFILELLEIYEKCIILFDIMIVKIL